MTSKPERVETLRRGAWTLESGAVVNVWIIRQTWDAFYEEFDDDPPDLSEDGWAYYALYGYSDHLAESTSRSQTFESQDKAVASVEAQYPVSWTG